LKKGLLPRTPTPKNFNTLQLPLAAYGSCLRRCAGVAMGSSVIFMLRCGRTSALGVTMSASYGSFSMHERINRPLAQPIGENVRQSVQESPFHEYLRYLHLVIIHFEGASACKGLSRRFRGNLFIDGSPV
jgi:hypothetical protein